MESQKMENDSVITLDFTDILESPRKGFTLHSQGAEAKLYRGVYLNGKPTMLKERFIKTYRHPELDKALSVERLKQEARTLFRCIEVGISCPTIYFVDLEERLIFMEYIENSITIKEFIFEIKAKSEKDVNLEHLGKRLGSDLALMHKNDIVHGDLTTSNMLLYKSEKSDILCGKPFHLYFIDFGLSKKQSLAEDKAVDMYVLERAILSSHPEAQSFFEIILKYYFENIGKSGKAIMEKLKDVQQRGRKRSMVG